MDVMNFVAVVQIKLYGGYPQRDEKTEQDGDTIKFYIKRIAE